MILQIKPFDLSKLLLISLLLLSSTFSFATTPGLSKTENQLKELNSQISKLKQTLSSAEDKREILNKELSGTEKKIGESVHQLRSMQTDMKTKQQKITSLQGDDSELKKQLLRQLEMLREHLRIRYKMGEYQPLKWLLNQNDPYSISRILSFHQYFIQARQKLIAEIETTRQRLKQNQENLIKELHSQQQLQNQLSSHQQLLERNKLYHQSLLHTINNDIHSKQLTLSSYERNKENLAKLIKQLSTQTIVQSNQPFTRMRKKLPIPVHTDKQNLQKMNQGLTFFAGEGTPVTAVYPGKVVFSDWLNGYGLLLILDHGQGFMTLYAHNQSLFKQKGASVVQGEQIAAVGHSGGLKQNGLYFEVRYRGKAVSPLDWLS